MKNIDETAQEVIEKYDDVFGYTPLREGIEDVVREAMEASRFNDLPGLREELGDLLSSALANIRRCGWNPSDLVKENLAKVERRRLQYRSLGRKTYVAILGGAFNPPTLDHINVAKFVLNTSRTFDEVWLMPCFQHMYDKHMESAEDRLAMCRLAAKVDGRIKVCDFEIKNELRGETYQLVKRLLNDPISERVNFSWVIGMDNANTFNEWVNYEHLERMIRFVVVQRGGIKADPKVDWYLRPLDWYLRPPHIYLADIDGRIGNGSSTAARKLLGGSKEINAKDYYESLAKLLDPEILSYIEGHNLYNSRNV